MSESLSALHAVTTQSDKMQLVLDLFPQKPDVLLALLLLPVGTQVLLHGVSDVREQGVLAAHKERGSSFRLAEARQAGWLFEECWHRLAWGRYFPEQTAELLPKQLTEQGLRVLLLGS